VKLFLPRALVEMQEQTPPSRPGAVRPMTGVTILLVDDDSAVREVTTSILHDLGYRVIEAGSGGAALEALDNNAAVDLVLLDFAMPGMNGAEVAQEIRTRRPQMPILFATGYADAEALTEAGEDRIVHKPFIEDELADKLALALGSVPEGANILVLKR
jgi:CheY-like chemotaxis protein